MQVEEVSMRIAYVAGLKLGAGCSSDLTADVDPNLPLGAPLKPPK